MTDSHSHYYPRALAVECSNIVEEEDWSHRPLFSDHIRHHIRYRACSCGYLEDGTK